MRAFGSAFIGLAGCGAVLALVTSTPIEANQLAARAILHRANLRQAPMATASTAPTAQPCPTSQPASSTFVGVSEGLDVAGGAYAAVLGGYKNHACSAGSGISGGSNNVIGKNDTTGKQAELSFIGGGSTNAIGGTRSFIGAGSTNAISSSYSFIGSGVENTITSPFSFIGAGEQNEVTGGGAFIGAGGYMFTSVNGKTGVANLAAGNDSFIGAGDGNDVAGSAGFIGGGQSNSIPSAAPDAVVAGGNSNAAGGSYATIGGGSGNTARAAFATIPGGADDEALGTASFAAGYHAEAADTGSFVWSDDVSGSALVADKAADQFVVRASGGVYVYSSENLASGVKLAAGSGAWASLSDRHAKTDVEPIDDRSILEKISSLPIGTWEYKTEPGVRHAGPMAQDFYAAFRLGADDRHITSVDEDGVMLAAIKALDGENDALEAKQRHLRAEVAALKASRNMQLRAFAERGQRNEREALAERNEIAALNAEMDEAESKVK